MFLAVETVLKKKEQSIVWPKSQRLRSIVYVYGERPGFSKLDRGGKKRKPVHRRPRVG